MYATEPVSGTNEVYVPLTAINATNNQEHTIISQETPVDNGQQIIQQFQIQLPDQSQMLDPQNQQIQVIQSDPNNPEQPQVITLYTWGGN